MAITQRQITLEEFLTLPEEKPALEYLGGTVTRKVSPKHKHGRLQYAFAAFVNRFAEPLELAMAFTETRATFGGGSTVPDVIVYAWDRVPLDQDGEIADDSDIPPDIAVEILFPGQSVSAAIDRCRWYIQEGVVIALLINPRDHSVRRLQVGVETAILRGHERIDLDQVLPGFELTVEQLFGALRPRRSDR